MRASSALGIGGAAIFCSFNPALRTGLIRVRSGQESRTAPDRELEERVYSYVPGEPKVRHLSTRLTQNHRPEPSFVAPSRLRMRTGDWSPRNLPSWMSVALCAERQAAAVSVLLPFLRLGILALNGPKPRRSDLLGTLGCSSRHIGLTKQNEVLSQLAKHRCRGSGLQSRPHRSRHCREHHVDGEFVG